MADFDQLIKDKLEQTEYSYKHSAWKSFAKRAGIKTGLSAWSVSLVMVLVVSLLTIGGIAFRNSEFKVQSSTPNVQRPTANSQQPTADSQVQNSESKVQSSTPNGQKPTTNPQRPTANSQQPTADNQVQNSEFKVQSSKVNGQEPTTNSQQPIYGPPVELRVDTITQMEPTDEQLRQGNSRIF